MLHCTVWWKSPIRDTHCLVSKWGKNDGFLHSVHDQLPQLLEDPFQHCLLTDLCKQCQTKRKRETRERTNIHMTFFPFEPNSIAFLRTEAKTLSCSIQNTQHNPRQPSIPLLLHFYIILLKIIPYNTQHLYNNQHNNPKHSFFCNFVGSS